MGTSAALHKQLWAAAAAEPWQRARAGAAATLASHSSDKLQQLNRCVLSGQWWPPVCRRTAHSTITVCWIGNCCNRLPPCSCSWYEQQLPVAIAGRAPRQHMTQPELAQLVRGCAAAAECVGAPRTPSWRCGCCSAAAVADCWQQLAGRLLLHAVVLLLPAAARAMLAERRGSTTCWLVCERQA